MASRGAEEGQGNDGMAFHAFVLAGKAWAARNRDEVVVNKVMLAWLVR